MRLLNNMRLVTKLAVPVAIFVAISVGLIALARTVGDLMTRDPVTVGPDATAREAGRLISNHRHNRLPVVDGDGRLLGVVTRIDVLEALLEEE